MKIIGFTAGHDSAYGILDDGVPIVHNELERFNRQKGCKGDSLKLFLDEEDKQEFSYHTSHRTGNISFHKGSLDGVQSLSPKSTFYIAGHHQSHAANAFYTSPYDEALIITIDGGGVDYIDGRENPWKDMDDHTSPGSIITSFTIWYGKDNKIKPIKMFDRNDINIGYYWDHCTYHIFGLNRNPVRRGEEGTVMGMAAFGNPDKYITHFRNLSEFKLHMKGPYDFDFLVNEAKKDEQNMFDIAASLQKETERAIKKILKPYIEEYKPKNLCLSGGVSLNCVLTGKMLDWYPNVNIFCDPIPYDAGLALGSCRYVWHDVLDKPRIYNTPQNHSSYLGLSYDKDSVLSELDKVQSKIEFETADDDKVVDLLLVDDNVISLFGGGSESGRRALGNRSIIADPRSLKMKDIINEKVKHRQWFRPFAPSVLREDVKDWFIHDIGSPYMSFAIPFKEGMAEKVPAVVHNDGTARLQTVKKEDNEWYYNFIKKFNDKTGIPIVLNTSFNDREPIVETPEHAINCFLRTDIDYLYFREFGILVRKS